MTNRARALDRVEEDLRRGHTHVAVQRLSSLVQQDPTNLDLRRRLAAVHLSTGNWVEAGRWSYLEEDRDAVACAAFERAHPDPHHRLRQLTWPPYRWGEVPQPARDRLDDLAGVPRRRGAVRGTPLVRQTAGVRLVDGLRDAGTVVCVLVNVAVWVLGYVALIRWIW